MGKLKARPIVVQPRDPAIKLIALTQNQVAVVDASDYEWLMQWTWRANKIAGSNIYYAARSEAARTSRRTLFMHIKIMGQEGDGRIVDHKNHDTLDNRRENLRLCTYSDNRFNSVISNNNTTGFRGVSFNKQKQKWTSLITFHGVRHFLGCFETPEEASEVYQRALLEKAGDFAWTNNERETNDVYVNTATTGVETI